MFFKNRFFQLFTRNNSFISISNLFSFSVLFDFHGLTSNPTFLSIEHIKVQELSFLSEYFLITALFCLTLFALFSIKPSVEKEYFSIKFQYNNQLIFLLIFTLICYLILVYQQMNFSVSILTSFNDSIINDSLAITAKFIIGLSSICYLIFITKYLKDQKLNNFEYYIILLTSIFGFFLLCCTNEFITAYLAIELQGLAFYVLASFKKSSNFSVESGIKYFVIGSLSTALFLLGVTFVYGFSGSLVLTDFNDFFIWVFSTNSFFLSLDSVSKALESFNTQISVIDENPSISKLQVISDSLDVIKKVDPSMFDVEVLKPTTCDLSTIELRSNIYDKMFDIYSQMDLTGTTSNNLIQTNYILSSLSTFLIEKNFQNLSIELLSSLQDNQIGSNQFSDFYNDLIEACYYEDIGLENLILKDTSENFLKFSDTIMFDSYSDNVYQLLKSCYYSECILGLTQFSEYLRVQDGILSDEISEAFKVISGNFLTFLENSKINSDLESQSYMAINIFSLNNFFFELCNVNSVVQDSSVYDFSFIIFGMVIILLALLFKLALAPFHLWSPDVYEGSPTSSTFFFIVISKLGIFVFLIRLFYSSFYSFMPYWQFYSILVATTSIFIGAVAGLKQRKLKSLLTYSSINNMGFVLLAFSVGSFEGVQIKFYYLIVYILTSLCVWGIILNLKLKKKMYSEKQNRDLGDLALLQESNNIIAQNLAVTLFTMAGLPPMVGFLAKMGVFKALTGVSIYFFSVVNILFSVIATFYYLRIVKIIFFENLLVGSLYSSINSKKVFLINFLNFLLGFLFISPVFLYLYSYKITLFINKGFY